LVELEAQMEQLNKQDAALKAKINTAKDTINSDERKIKTLQKNIQIDENALNKKENEMEKVSKNYLSI
jgi:chromosome segregation ATPase